jgi:hypothetical protein
MLEVENALFRANPSYHLVQLDRLSYADRNLLDTLDETALYGLLQPSQGSSLKPRSVSRDTALLLFTLMKPGRIPSYLKTNRVRQQGNCWSILITI